MANFAGAKQTDLHSSSAGRNYVPAWDINEVPPIFSSHVGHHDDYLKALGPLTGGTITKTPPAPVVPTNFSGHKQSAPRDDFFEKILVIPKSIAAGLILATYVDDIDIYSSYTKETRVFQSYINNAGAGVVITNLPGLPVNMAPQTGFNLILNVLVSGPPAIDGTLDFGFDTITEKVTLTGTRMTLFPYEPIDITEILEFRTNIIKKRNGKEQRVAIRSLPRQILDMKFMVEDVERQGMEAIIMDSHGRAFGIPLWMEPAIAQGAITATDTTVTVDSTQYSHLKVGGFAVTWKDGDVAGNEVLEVKSLTDTTIEFNTAYTNSFPAGVRIMPIHFGYMGKSTKGRKYPVDLQEMGVRFTVLDVQDLADTSAFSSFNSKVLLDEPNAISGTLTETMNRPLIVLDGEAGIFEISSFVPISRRGHPKTFFSNTRKRLWEIRQLIHALKGKAISFYMPTFYEDFYVTTDIVSAQNTMRFKFIGYTKHVQSRQPRNVVRIVKTNGTSVTRTVTGSSEISATEEQITVDTTWGQNISVSEIDRVEFIEKVRADNDEIRFKYNDPRGGAMVSMPLMAVLE